MIIRQKINLLRRSNGRGSGNQSVQGRFKEVPKMVDRFVSSSMTNSQEQLNITKLETFQNPIIKGKIEEMERLQNSDLSGIKEEKQEQNNQIKIQENLEQITEREGGTIQSEKDRPKQYSQQSSYSPTNGLKQILAKEQHIRRSIKIIQAKRKSIENWKSLQEESKREHNQMLLEVKSGGRGGGGNGLPNSFISVNQLLKMKNHQKNTSNASISSNTEQVIAKEIDLQDERDSQGFLPHHNHQNRGLSIFDEYQQNTQRLSINSQFLENTYSNGQSPRNAGGGVSSPENKIQVQISQKKIDSYSLENQNRRSNKKMNQQQWQQKYQTLHQFPKIVRVNENNEMVGISMNEYQKTKYGSMQPNNQLRNDIKNEFQNELKRKINHIKNLNYTTIQSGMGGERVFGLDGDDQNQRRRTVNGMAGAILQPLTTVYQPSKFRQIASSISPDHERQSNVLSMKQSMQNMRNTTMIHSFQESFKEQEKHSMKYRRQLKVLERQYQTNNELVSQKYRILNNSSNLAFKDAKLSKYILFDKNSFDELKSFTNQQQQPINETDKEIESLLENNSVTLQPSILNKTTIPNEYDYNPFNTTHNKFKQIEFRRKLQSKFLMMNTDYIDNMRSTSYIKACRTKTPQRQTKQSSKEQLEELRKVAAKSNMERSYHISTLGKQANSNEKSLLMMKPIHKIVELINNEDIHE